jgi:hypothetical protein
VAPVWGHLERIDARGYGQVLKRWRPELSLLPLPPRIHVAAFGNSTHLRRAGLVSACGRCEQRLNAHATRRAPSQ